jgi:hypothetical protein
VKIFVIPTYSGSIMVKINHENRYIFCFMVSFFFPQVFVVTNQRLTCFVSELYFIFIHIRQYVP